MTQKIMDLSKKIMVCGAVAVVTIDGDIMQIARIIVYMSASPSASTVYTKVEMLGDKGGVYFAKSAGYGYDKQHKNRIALMTEIVGGTEQTRSNTDFLEKIVSLKYGINDVTVINF